MNENIAEDDEIFANTPGKPHSTFKNTRKLSIFGKTTMESRRTTDFTLTSKIDEDEEYERNRNEEIESWIKLVAGAKEDYIKTKKPEPMMGIEDLPENYKSFLKNQMDALNAHIANELNLDRKLEDTYLEFLSGMKNLESKKSVVYDSLKDLVEQKTANVNIQLFP